MDFLHAVQLTPKDAEISSILSERGSTDPGEESLAEDTDMSLQISDFPNQISRFIENQDDNGLEYIPYEEFSGVELISKGESGCASKAIWKKKHDEVAFVVALKKIYSYDSGGGAVTGVLKELEAYKYIMAAGNTPVPPILKYYGLSQDPATSEPLIVQEYANYGNLWTYLQRHFDQLTWPSRVKHLQRITECLKAIHELGLVHGNLHSGNILVHKNSTYIADLGAGKDDDVIYGVLPYVAPEIFMNGTYSMATDLYCFGVIMWELATGERPMADRPHDIELAHDICNGLRPAIPDHVPACYADLMMQCWDSDPNNRPIAASAYNTLSSWIADGNEIEELKVAEEKKPTSRKEPKTIHPEAVYVSKSLNSLIILTSQRYNLDPVSRLGEIEAEVRADDEHKHNLDQELQINIEPADEHK
ncbi:3267_t:CDS:2 [Paraglomus occultum]|uniref:3267_t:CDS:1 n=1 Tax=Paraglomus occultum TaxID=144539 RepID=A0A9N9CA42_9GLOM|nr:3267_t:CDS:2 [Paraglomus occultum]